MKTFTVRDLRARTGELIGNAEAGQLSVVTKHGRPVFVAAPFDDRLLSEGVHIALAIRLFELGVISLSKAARLASISTEAMIEKLGALRIPIAEHSAEELASELERLPGQR